MILFISTRHHTCGSADTITCSESMMRTTMRIGELRVAVLSCTESIVFGMGGLIKVEMRGKE